MTAVDCAAEGELLVADVTPSALGFTPCRMWNPSPSVKHRLDPYPLPQRLTIGMLGNEHTGAKYSPPPFAVIVEGDAGQAACLSVRANAHWHRWGDVHFHGQASGVRVEIDFEGRTNIADAMSHVAVDVVTSKAGESRHDLLARTMRTQYPGSTTDAASIPAWWRRPIYCGWGDQVSFAYHQEGVGVEPRALAYCIQGLYERWIRRLDEAEVPWGTTTIDAGWSPAGVWDTDVVKWPNLRGFIDAEHAKGRKVLLWIATWLWDGLPDEWCVITDGIKTVADPTNPAYRDFIAEKVHHLLSPDGLDADGFKIDQNAYTPSVHRPRHGPRFGWTRFEETRATDIRIHGDQWGCELLHLLQKTIYDAAKRAKPDALLTSSTVHPYFHDTLDMVRIHDMGHVAPDIMAAMKARCDLAAAALPGKPIDTDDWIHSRYDLWQNYTANSHTLGVPCIFYADRFMLNWTAEPTTQQIPLDDLRQIAAAWRAAGF